MLIRFLFLWGVGFFFLVQARKLAEHRRKYERKREEKDMKERLARAQRIKEEREKAAKEVCISISFWSGASLSPSRSYL